MLRAFTTFMGGLMAFPWGWKLWVGLMAAANMLAPLYFWEMTAARVTLATFFVSFGLGIGLAGFVGFTRLMGLMHILWIPLLVYLCPQLPGDPLGNGASIWIWSVFLINGTSLIIDAVDVTRYIRGERQSLI